MDRLTQERFVALRDEEADLGDRIGLLSVHVVVADIGPEERMRLNRQLGHMRAYDAVLRERMDVLVEAA